ncbi:somatotropin [Pleuronectes platessa]|uniref:Somatotropin n=2 Tax=Pleuronectidae TaxID=8256 RepID=R9W159_PLASA|nr:somatotropin [Pleuronectes platessa]XP_062264966.1 somatotropin [Platichthys flesus]AGN90992.1 growth hormone [Platichthys stellatus]
MNRVILLLSVMCVGVSSQPITENQRLFSIAVGRVQYLHLVAKKLFSDFENSLQLEDQRQLNKIFLQDFCHSDYFLSPIDKHETQRSSVLKLLSISYRLIESWEFSSRFLVAGFAVRTQVTSKLSELKTGLMKLIEANQDGASGFSESSVIQLTPYGNYYQSVGVDESFRRNYELFACFKKDMHKVETYLTVAKCRLSPEANCTL